MLYVDTILPSHCDHCLSMKHAYSDTIFTVERAHWYLVLLFMGTHTAVHGCISIFITFHCLQTIVRHLVPAVESRPTAVLCFVCPVKAAQKKEQPVLMLWSDVMLEVRGLCTLPYDVIIFFLYNVLSLFLYPRSFFSCFPRQGGWKFILLDCSEAGIFVPALMPPS